VKSSRLKNAVLVHRDGAVGGGWIATPLNGPSLEPPRRGALHEIVRPGDEVCLLAPATDARAERIQLPRMRTAELAQAIPYALEEQLAQEPEDLQFALGRRIDGRYVVHFVAKTRLAGWLAAVAAGGASVSAVCSEWDLLPDSSSDICIAVRDVNVVMLRTRDGACIAAECDVIERVLQGLLPDTAAHGATVECYGAVPDALAQCATLSMASCEVRPALDWSALHMKASARRLANLLHSTAQLASSRSGLRVWRGALAALAGCLVLGVAAASVHVYQLQELRDEWDVRMIERYRQAFPQERKVADVRRQLRLKLRGLGGTNARESVLAGVSLMARAQGSKSGIAIVGMRFDDSVLSVDLRGQTFADLQRYSAAVQALAAGASVNLSAALATQDGAQATLRYAKTAP